MIDSWHDWWSNVWTGTLLRLLSPFVVERVVSHVGWSLRCSNHPPPRPYFATTSFYLCVLLNMVPPLCRCSYFEHFVCLCAVSGVGWRFDFPFVNHISCDVIAIQIRFDWSILLIYWQNLVRQYRISTVQIMQQLQQFSNSSPLNCLVIVLPIGPVLPLVVVDWPGLLVVCFVF